MTGHGTSPGNPVYVRQDGKVIRNSAYNVLAVNLQGNKDLLGILPSSRFWLSVLNDLQNRGVKDVLICWINNLKGFADAIETVFLSTDVWLYLVLQVRNSLRYVTSNDHGTTAAELKPVYQVASLPAVEQNLAAFAAKWGDKYP